MNVPRALYLTTSALTVVAMWVLVRKLPDFFLRSAVWLRAWGHNTLRTVGLDHVPLDGPVILATNCDSFVAALDLIAAVDRYPRIILVETVPGDGSSSRLRSLARRTGLLSLDRSAGRPDWDRAIETGLGSLRSGDMVALTVDGLADPSQAIRLIERWRAAVPAIVIPVNCTASRALGHGELSRAHPHPRVVFGAPLTDSADLQTLQGAIAELASVTEDNA